MNSFSWAWLIWFTVVVATFFIIEILALERKNRGDGEPDTLTSHIQKLTRTRWIRDIAAGVLIGLAFWFFAHLWL